ncbi:integrase arm-type DNA-binding domain-containing protein [Aggregatibacter actinomycetemcomitans]|uniref:integrase arm-type DNA-binding domain-containing protein n=1 Tax=Aggregatibacter actinomycetemcomitans TaxID=714 RepID=UPI0030D0FC63
MPRITKPLTNTEVEKAKPKDEPYTLTDGKGLFLLVLTSGIKSWHFNYLRLLTKRFRNLPRFVFSSSPFYS